MNKQLTGKNNNEAKAEIFWKPNVKAKNKSVMLMEG